MMLIVVKLSVGPIISMFFYMFVQLINTYFIGHTNDSTLIAGVGMGNMLINVLAFAIMQGLNGALETLISRSYGLSNDETKL
jgi:Na+-driven multidrug efflux pump